MLDRTRFVRDVEIEKGADKTAAFNAVGAYLTNLIPGYYFDPSLVGTSDACPLDAHGNLE